MTEPQTKPARRIKGTAEAPRQKRAARRQAAAPVAVTDTGAPIPDVAGGENRSGPSGKLGIVVAMMRRPEGATVAQMGEATDWQPHSVRGALAGALKKKHKLNIVSEPAEGGRVYRIAVDAAA